jgi:uncharacterized membrane protein HdeD (DUF308 family)
MNLFLHTTKSQVAMMALVYFVFGLLLCFFDTTVLTVATRLLGVAAIIYGWYLLYRFFYLKANKSAMPIYIGIPCILFGLVMAFSPESLIRIIPALVAVLLILNSIIQIQKAFTLKSLGFAYWFGAFILSLVMLVAGFVILLQPIQALSFILPIVGIALMAEGIVLFFNLYELNKYRTAKHAMPAR